MSLPTRLEGCQRFKVRGRTARASSTAGIGTSSHRVESRLSGIAPTWGCLPLSTLTAGMGVSTAPGVRSLVSREMKSLRRTRMIGLRRILNMTRSDGLGTKSLFTGRRIKLIICHLRPTRSIGCWASGAPLIWVGNRSRTCQRTDQAS